MEFQAVWQDDWELQQRHSGAGFGPGVVVVGPGAVVFAPFADGQAVGLEVAEAFEALVFAIPAAAGLVAVVGLLGVERQEVLHQHAESVLSAKDSAGFVHLVFFEPSQYLEYSSNLSLLLVD